MPHLCSSGMSMSSESSTGPEGNCTAKRRRHSGEPSAGLDSTRRARDADDPGCGGGAAARTSSSKSSCAAEEEAAAPADFCRSLRGPASPLSTSTTRVDFRFRADIGWA
eukprot:1754435-Alexandrium_andersonii.AAC.1